jgi:IS605 OrfB family transposase
MRPLPTTRQETGIDLGIEAFATLSDGTCIFNPGWYRNAERALKTAQRRVSCRQKGSNRRRTAAALLAKAHQTVRRQRQDFHYKTALQLVRANDPIYHEDLRTATRVRNHHLAKSIQDAGWAAFLSILSFKATCAGRSVIAVNPAYTPHTPRRPVRGVEDWSQKACPSAGIAARTAAPACTETTTPPRTENGSVSAFGERWRRLPRRTEHSPAFAVRSVKT